MAQRRADCGILDVRMNQDNECFVCSLQSGIRVFNVDPMVSLRAFPASLVGSARLTEMQHRTNRIAFVGGDSAPLLGDNVVAMLDAHTSKLSAAYTMTNRVLNVRMLRNMICICIVDQIVIYSLDSPAQVLRSFHTKSNPQGLCIVTRSTADRCLLAFPATARPGRLQLENLNAIQPSTASTSSAPPVVIDAHQHDVACAVFNSSGTMVATASEHGTLIRVHDTASRALLIELRRGSEPASIFCLNFSETSDFLCAASDKGTVHVFSVKDGSLNTRGTLGVIGSWVGVDAQWSLAKFTVPSECECQCSFIGDNSVVALCVDGTIHRYSFSLDGKCHRELYDVVIDRYVNADL